MGQQIFDPISYGWKWTADWYEWDSKAGHIAARQARDAFAKELKAKGHLPRKFSLPNQLMSKGGIGSGHPHIEIVQTAYGVNW